MRDEPRVLIMSLASADLFPTAKAMLRFMYTQKLEEGVSRSELLQLLKLADEYGVALLRCACLQQLNHAPVDQWSGTELQLLYEVLDIVCSDSLAAGELGSAARATISSIAALFIELEEAWRGKEQRRTFRRLPYAVVLRILSSDDLVTKSENTVLVAALSWLRGLCGKGASQEERREVLQQVRLLQLSPWFVSWLAANVPESQELLQPASVAKLVLYLATPEPSRQVYQAQDPLLQRWAERRKGAVPAMTADVEVSMSKQAVLDAVLECRKNNKAVSPVNGDSVFFDGFEWEASVQLACADSGVVKVYGGVYTYQMFGGAHEQRAMPSCPASFILTVGDKIRHSIVRAVAGTRLTNGVMKRVAKVGPDDDPATVLEGCMKDGKLTVHARVVQ